MQGNCKCGILNANCVLKDFYMENFESLSPVFRGKKVLYITTKNLDYIRVTQEINLLKELSEQVTVIGSSAKGYGKRLAHVFKSLMTQKMDEIDVAFVGFAPQLVLPFFGRKLRAKTLVIDFFISVYDTMVCDRKKYSDYGLIGRMCHRLDKKTLAKADYVICDTVAHGEFFAEEFKCQEDKLRVLYLQADSSIYYPRPAQNEEGPKKILYFGSILNLQGVDVILDALRIFDNDDRFTFEIIGPIPAKMNRPQQSNVKYIDWLSQQQLAEHIATADLCLAGHFSGTIMKAKRTIPGKAYIYEAMEKPMILGDGPANHELFTADERHRFAEMGNPEALAKAIKEFFNYE